jgi:2-C-methyl-D-erythritol 4-phosphate cytidylyltransferase
VLATDGADIFVSNAALLDATSVQARLQVVDSAGVMLLDAARALTPSRLLPNGEGCKPTVWQAAVSVGADGALQVDPVTL